MAYVIELQQVETILSANMATYGSQIDWGNEGVGTDADVPTGIEGDNKMSCLVQYASWGHGHDTGTYWITFVATLVNKDADSDEDFEKACKELLEVQENYNGGAATVPFSVKIQPMPYNHLPYQKRVYKIIAYWSK
jgi:hypothetical protein